MKFKFISKLEPKEFDLIFNEIFDISKFMSEQYPNFENWYKQKIKERIKNNEGEIIFVKNEKEIEGFIILKNTKTEQKICTIFVKEKYRKQKIGRNLIEEGIVYLENLKPVITIPEKKLKLFSYFIKRYDWKKTSISNDYNTPEIIFNEK